MAYKVKAEGSPLSGLKVIRWSRGEVLALVHTWDDWDYQTLKELALALDAVLLEGEAEALAE